MAESIKYNGSFTNGNKKMESETVPHSEHDDPGLVFTGRFCGGLMDDIKRKAPWFWSDFKDGINFQCLSSVLFMYFACLSPIITFGGLLGTATDFNMVSFYLEYLENATKYLNKFGYELKTFFKKE